MDESFTTDENVDLDNVVEEEEETITSGSSTAGDIRSLILSINTTREMLIKCGYKSVTIDTSKATVIETMDGKRKEIIPARVSRLMHLHNSAFLRLLCIRNALAFFEKFLYFAFFA